jgi:hypothetical protein
MLLLLSAAASLVLWVLLWGLGAKAIDALLLSLLVMILAATAHIVLPFLPGRRSSKANTRPDPAPFN